MKRLACLIAPLALACLAMPAQAAEANLAAEANPQVDFEGFVALSASLAETRAQHRLPFEEFMRRTREEGAILLDARSAAAFAQGHIEGAVNLPLPDFTDEALAETLGPDRNRPIYIYCNNNFSDDAAPVVTKRATLALNIPTFINLHGYGYTNVWELADIVASADEQVPWVSGGAGAAS